MDPLDALNEIAYLLERSLASGFRTKAFRTAAAALAAIPPDERAERARDGRLKRTKGIGDTSFEVISEALAGTIPTYLANLREADSKTLASGGEKLRAQLKGDLHSHSEWSDG